MTLRSGASVECGAGADCGADAARVRRGCGAGAARLQSGCRVVAEGAGGAGPLVEVRRLEVRLEPRGRVACGVDRDEDGQHVPARGVEPFEHLAHLRWGQGQGQDQGQVQGQGQRQG